MLIFKKLSRYFKNKKMKSRFVRNVNSQKTSDFYKILYFSHFILGEIFKKTGFSFFSFFKISSYVIKKLFKILFNAYYLKIESIFEKHNNEIEVCMQCKFSSN